MSKSRLPDRFVIPHTRLREDQIAKGLLGTHGNPRTCFGLGVSTDVPIRRERVLFIKVGDIL
jgi:hypothetical protein